MALIVPPHRRSPRRASTDATDRAGSLGVIEVRHVTDAELRDLLSHPSVADEVTHEGGSVLVVAPGGEPPGTGHRARLASLPCIVVAVDRDPGAPPPAHADLVVEAPLDAVDAVLDQVAANPLAATALTLLLRTASRARDDTPAAIGAGLVAESAVYSMLQGGPEFSRWRSARPRRSRAEPDGPAVLVDRVGERLLVELHRPHVRNAFDARIRDELIAALAVAAYDDTVADVVLRGARPDFCSGGDLDEFGDVRRSRRPPTRSACSAAPVGPSTSWRDRVHRRTSTGTAPDRASSSRPSPTGWSPIRRCGRRCRRCAMGLIPGAGGTVSLPARIGRHRTALLALAGVAIDAPTALAWGLVDEIADGAAIAAG